MSASDLESAHPTPGADSARSSPLDEFLAAARRDADGALERLLPPTDEPPERLHAAMRYSVFAGGKRVRPALVMLVGETLGAPRERLLPAAAAVEMIHTFSLVHDDLPALDDDDLRRGRQTVHRRFDEATAVLVGDALLDLGLSTLADHPTEVAAERRLAAVSLVAGAVGTAGMIGGQAADLEAEDSWPQDAVATLESIHRRKTGALLIASIRLGGLYAEVSATTDELLGRLGEAIGLLFQIGDDILDVERSTEELGKTAGKDAEARKLTYPGLFGIEESKRRLAEVKREALDLAAGLPGDGDLLQALIDYLAERQS